MDFGDSANQCLTKVGEEYLNGSLQVTLATVEVKGNFSNSVGSESTETKQSRFVLTWTYALVSGCTLIGFLNWSFEKDRLLPFVVEV